MYDFYIELYNVDEENKLYLENKIIDIMRLKDTKGTYKIVKEDD